MVKRKRFLLNVPYDPMYRQMCKYFSYTGLENVFEKNPKGFLDKTPLHYAALNGLKGKYDSLLQIKHTFFFIKTWMWMN